MGIMGSLKILICQVKNGHGGKGTRREFFAEKRLQRPLSVISH